MAEHKIENIITEYHLNRHQPGKPQFAIHNLKEYLRKHQQNAVKPHIHSFYQVIWFTQGIGKHFVDFNKYDVKENVVFFIAKNQVHYFNENRNYEGYLLHFNEAFLTQKDSKTDFFLKYNLFNNPYQLPFCLIDHKTQLISATYISQIQREFGNNIEFGKEEILRAYLKSFLIQLQRQKNEVENNSKDVSFAVDEKKEQLIKFTNLLEENYTKGFTVSEYARLLSISSRTLSDLTHQLLNKTPSQLIHERIILEAKRLLIHSALNVNQIGYRLGFGDPSYFLKFFKKYTSTTPTKFRNSIS